MLKWEGKENCGAIVLPTYSIIETQAEGYVEKFLKKERKKEGIFQLISKGMDRSARTISVQLEKTVSTDIVGDGLEGVVQKGYKNTVDSTNAITFLFYT